MNTKKKSQAAMEFLMTYGWALLVVLIVIIALGFFGLLDPGKYLGDKCDLGTPGLRCADYNINSTDVTIIVKNNLGKNIYALNITAIDRSSVLSNPATKKGTKVRFDLNVTYNTSENGGRPMFDHRFTGKLITTTTNLVTGNVVFSTLTAYGRVNGHTVLVWSYVPVIIPDETAVLRFRFQ